MSIPLLYLDDRKFADLVDELRSLIPRYAPGWTDHNISDPGIMLIELFAWLGEAQLYHLNRISEASRVRLLELLGVVFQPAQPAMLKLSVTANCLERPWTLKRGTAIEARPNPDRAVVVFETPEDVLFTPAAPQCTIQVRQTELVEEEAPRVGNGAAYQLFELEERFVTAPREPLPRRPKVWVGGEPWEFRATLSGSRPEDKHFTVRPWLNALVFGDGVHGQIPGENAGVTAAYRIAAPTRGRRQHEQLDNGNVRPAQIFRLSRPILALDLRESDELGPAVWVDNQPWDYRPFFLDMAENGLEYTLEPRRNAIRFGDGRHGRIPPAGAEIKICYHHTRGAEGNLPIGTTFSIKQEACDPRLRIGGKFEIVTCGSNPTELDEARDQVSAILQPRWRAITATDIETIVTQNHAEIARAHCLPGHDLGARDQQGYLPGHVGVIVIPQPTYQWAEATAVVREVVGFTPDGQRLVARGVDGVIRLWDMKRGSKYAILEGAIRDVAFSSDGKLIAAASDDQIVRIWDWDTKARMETRLLRHLLRHPATVNAVAFHPNGRYLSTACADKKVRLWKIASNEVVAEYQHLEPVNDVTFSADGHCVASASDDGTAILWNWEQNAQIAVVDHEAPVNAVTLLSPDGRHLATAGSDCTVCLWNLQSAPGIDALRHDAAVLDVAYRPHGDSPRCDLLATACSDGAARLWDMQHGVELALFPHSAPINALAFSPDGQRLATASEDQTVTLWDLSRRQRIVSLSHDAGVNAVAFTPDGRGLATAGNDRVVRRWDISTIESPQPTGYLAAVEDWVFSPDGRRLATITSDVSASLWDTENGARIALLSADSPVRKVSFSTDGQCLATASAPFVTTGAPLVPSGTTLRAIPGAVQTHVHVWDAIQGRPLACFAHDAQVVGMAFRTDCQHLATIDAEDRIQLWDIRRAQPAPGFSNRIQGQDAIFSPDGARLFTRTKDNEGTLWSTRTGKPIDSALSSTTVTHAVFSPDGRWLATAHPDKKVKCWNARNGTLAQAFAHEAEVEDLVFSPNSQRLVTIRADTNADYVIKLWDLRLRRDEAIRTDEVKGLKAVVINTSGQWLALVGERLLRVWDVETGADLSALYVDLARLSAAGKWRLGLFEPKMGRVNSILIGDGTQPARTNGDRLAGIPANRPPLQLMRGKFLLAMGDDDPNLPTRTFQLWNAEHVYDVDEFLTGRRLVTTQQHVKGPAYKDICACATVTRSKAAVRDQQLCEDVNRALLQFFHPLSGGPEGTGWPPGRAVYRSEVYQVIEGVAGVDHVESLVIKSSVFDPQDVADRVHIPPYHLVNCKVKTDVSI